MWVYLHNGQALEFPKATACKVIDNSLAVYKEREILATFKRRDVLYTSDVPAPPVGFN